MKRYGNALHGARGRMPSEPTDLPASEACYRRSTCADKDMLSLRQWLVTTWAELQHRVVISVKKDWKHVLMQKVVTLNTCCDTACLTFQSPHITTVLLRVTDDNPQMAVFRAFNISKNAANLQSDENVLQFTS